MESLPGGMRMDSDRKRRVQYGKGAGVWMYYSEIGRVLEKIILWGQELEIEDGY